MRWYQKIRLSILTTFLVSFNLQGQEIATAPTVVETGSIIFTQAEFDTLLVKLEVCVNKDSLLMVQDSLILEYQHLDTLNPPFWEQIWFQKILYSLIGVGVTKVIDNAN